MLVSLLLPTFPTDSGGDAAAASVSAFVCIHSLLALLLLLSFLLESLLLLASLPAIALISAVVGLPQIAGVPWVLNGVPAVAFVPGLAGIRLLFFSAIGRSEHRRTGKFKKLSDCRIKF